MNALDLLAPLAAIDGRDRKLQGLAGLHAADSLACLIAGARTVEGRALAVFYEESGLQPPLAPAAAAAAIIRHTEWDDIHVPTCVTPGAVAVPVALALTDSEEHFVAAVSAGYAIGVALGEAIGGVSALPETWPGLLAAPAISAVTASTALGLPPEQRAQALVMALAGSSGRNGRPAGAPSARWLAIGEATLKGMHAAFAARSGFKGDADLLSAQWLKAQSVAAGEWKAPRADAIASVGLKPFVAARQGIDAIEAFRQLLAEGVEPRAIEEVRVSLPPEATSVVSRPLDPDDRLSTIAHLGLQLGIAAFEPARLGDVGRTEGFGPDIRNFAQRVTVSADETLADKLPGSWPAKLAVRIGSEWIERICLTAPGDPGDGATARDLVARKIGEVCSADQAQVLESLSGVEAGAARRAFDMLLRTLAEAADTGSQKMRRAM